VILLEVNKAARGVVVKCQMLQQFCQREVRKQKASEEIMGAEYR
jgi:hypothetical protein